MAKIKCAKCGHIFAVTAIDEIQICPVCQQKMRVKPGAAAGNDEYASLRNEYMRLAREKRETRSGVYLTIEQYNQLIRQADAGAAALAAPQNNGGVVQPAAQPGVATTTVDPMAYANAYAYNTFGAGAQPVQQAQQAPVQQAPAQQAAPAQENGEEEKVKPAKLTKTQTIMNWVTFGIVLIAAVFAGLMLAFNITNVEGGPKGWDLLAPNYEGMEVAGTAWTLQLLTGVVVFLPVLLMLISLINTLRKGKVGKFVLSPFFLIAGLLIWIFPYMYSFLSLIIVSGQVPEFNFVEMITPTGFGWIIYAAAISSVVAFIMLIVGGAMVPSKKKRIALAEKQAEEEAAA